VAATPAPPAVTELPQPSLPEPSAAARTPVRPQAVAKSASTGGAAPVGTAGFGERE
jgi:hypothetical protein